MKISVIVPVYNSRAYLEECLSSIQNQQFDDWECILVDDGSTDESGCICDEWVCKDSRFIAYHTQNSGQSAARNFAVEKARGDYIAFVDSDDVIDRQMYKKLVDAAESNESDYTICGIYRFYPDGSIVSESLPSISIEGARNIYEKFIPGYIYPLDGCVYYIPSACRCLYKSCIIKSYNIRFPDEKVFLGEDLLFNLEYLLHCEKLSVVSECLYGYRVNNRSFTNSFAFNPARLASVFRMTERIRLLTDNDAEFDSCIYAKVLDSVSVCIKLSVSAQNFSLARESMAAARRNSFVRQAFASKVYTKLGGTLRLFCIMLKMRMYLPLYCMIKIFLMLNMSK